MTSALTLLNISKTLDKTVYYIYHSRYRRCNLIGIISIPIPNKNMRYGDNVADDVAQPTSCVRPLWGQLLHTMGILYLHRRAQTPYRMSCRFLQSRAQQHPV